MAVVVVMVVSVVAGSVAFAGPAAAQTTTLTVDADETVGNGGNTYASLSYALDNASSGDTVRVNDSDTHYTHDYLVDNPGGGNNQNGNVQADVSNVTIESFDGRARVVYNSTAAGDNGGQPTMLILADDVTVRGLELVKAGVSGSSLYGQSLKINDVTGAVVEDTRITTKNRSAHAVPGAVGGLAVQAGEATLRNNVVDDSGQGIYVYGGGASTCPETRHRTSSTRPRAHHPTTSTPTTPRCSFSTPPRRSTAARRRTPSARPF